MGNYADLSAVLNGTADLVGNFRVSDHRFDAEPLDAPVSTANSAATMVAEISELVDSSGGTYTLTVSIPTRGITYTTAAIAYNAAAATIEAALDTASPSTVANGEIDVQDSGAAGLSDGDLTLTASGSLAEMPVLITINAASVTGTSAGGEVTYTTAGQGDRGAVQALFSMAIVTGTMPQSGVSPTDWVKPAPMGRTRPKEYQIKQLAIKAAQEEGNDDYYDAVAALYLLPR